MLTKTEFAKAILQGYAASVGKLILDLTEEDALKSESIGIAMEHLNMLSSATIKGRIEKCSGLVIAYDDPDDLNSAVLTTRELLSFLPDTREGGNTLEVTIAPTADEVQDEEMMEDYDEDQLSDVVGREQGWRTYVVEVLPGDDFEVPSGHEGAISDELNVVYPKEYRDDMENEEGVLVPGRYHWDGKVITFIDWLYQTEVDPDEVDESERDE